MVEDVEKEVSVLQTYLVESFTDNCKEQRKVSKRGAIWWHHELETLRKNVIVTLSRHAGTNSIGLLLRKTAVNKS